MYEEELENEELHRMDRQRHGLTKKCLLSSPESGGDTSTDNSSAEEGNVTDGANRATPTVPDLKDVPIEVSTKKAGCVGGDGGAMDDSLKKQKIREVAVTETNTDKLQWEAFLREKKKDKYTEKIIKV